MHIEVEVIFMATLLSHHIGDAFDQEINAFKAT